MTIVVTGATGHFGRLAIESLLARGIAAGQIVAVGRSVEKIQDLADRGVIVKQAAYEDPEALRAAFAGADKLLFVSGSEVGQRVAQHANVIAERITQLGGEPDFNPQGLASRSHSQYVAGGSLLDMVREDLVAERIAVDSYNEIIRYLGDDDPTTRRAIEKILAKEEEHADDMKKILDSLSESELNAAKPLK